MVHALAVPGKVDGRDFDFLLGQSGGNLIGAVPFQRHGEDAPDDGGSFLPGFTAMMEEVEAGNVEAIIVKDMSRLGRDYLFNEKCSKNFYFFTEKSDKQVS